MPGIIYTMRDGLWKAQGMADIDPGGGPGTENPSPDLWFGTTLFGSSYAQYKEHTINGADDRWKQIQYDMSYGGNRGSAVTRVFQNPGQPHNWGNAQKSFFRKKHCIMYSSLDYYNDESSYKNGFKAWLDDKNTSDPDGETYVWYIFKHEFDNDDKPQGGGTGPYQIGTPGTGQINRWYDRNIWTREVLELVGYKDNADRYGGWLRFGMVSTGNLWQGGKSQNANTAWKSFANGMASYSGAGSGSEAGKQVSEIWDYMGADKYNPAWAGNNRYMDWDDWSKHFALCHDYTGLPIVIGEAGSPRASQTLGQNLTQRNQERAAWLENQFARMKAAGYYDAVCYWNVPANSNNLNAWSTNMITPNGYNATLGGNYSGSDAQANGGFDDQYTFDVLSEYSVTSIAEANALGVGPQLDYYTGGGGFG